jgi:hypothetical protein
VSDPGVPRLPRGRGIRLAGPQMVRIVMFAVLLVAVIVLARPCGDAVERYFQSFDPPAPDAAPAVKQPDPFEGRYHEIKPGMTDEEIKQVIEKARQEAGQGVGSGSGAK